MRAGPAHRFPISVGRGCSGYAKGNPTKKKSLTGKSGKAQPVPPTGIEPVRCFHRGILSPLRLPVPPRRLTVWYCSAKRGNCQSAKPCRPECKKANGLFAVNGKAAHFMWQCTRYFICDVFLYPPTSHIFHIVRCAAADTGNRAMPQVMQEHQRRDAPGQRVCPEDDPDIMDKV